MKSSNGTMLPLTAIAKVAETTGPDVIERFNLFPSARLFGGPAPGYSSGQALAAMEELAAQDAAGGLSARVVGAVVSGKDELAEHGGHLRARGADGVPDSRGSVRAADAAVRGDPGGAVRGVRRVRRGVGARVVRRSLSADRARHAGGPCREERDPDRRVRGAHSSRRRQVALRSGGRSARTCASGRS